MCTWLRGLCGLASFLWRCRRCSLTWCDLDCLDCAAHQVLSHLRIWAVSLLVVFLRSVHYLLCLASQVEKEGERRRWNIFKSRFSSSRNSGLLILSEEKNDLYVLFRSSIEVREKRIKSSMLVDLLDTDSNGLSDLLWIIGTRNGSCSSRSSSTVTCVVRFTVFGLRQRSSWSVFVCVVILKRMWRDILYRPLYISYSF